MASIWLEPINHEIHGTYSDPIKLRRPMVIAQIRISKPPPEPIIVEFWARNLKTPSDELSQVTRIERMQDSTSQDILVTLDEPVLTNYLLVKGDYKNLTLCLEANEPELATVQKHPQLVNFTQDQDSLHLLTQNKLSNVGLYHYWADPNNGEVHSLRYGLHMFMQPVRPWMKGFKIIQNPTSVQNLDRICSSLLQGQLSQKQYLQGLEYLGQVFKEVLKQEHSLGKMQYVGDLDYEGICQQIPVAALKVALQGLMGTRFGNAEARYTLDLVNSVVNLPLFVKIFVEEGGLQNIMLLLTHPNVSSLVQTKIVKVLQSLLTNGESTKMFFEYDFINGLAGEVLERFIIKGKVTGKKGENLEYKQILSSPYKVCLSLLSGKKNPKLIHQLKLLINQASFYQMLEKFKEATHNKNFPILTLLEQIRKNLKLLMLKSSSKANSKLKHDMQCDFLENQMTSLSHLQKVIVKTSQPVLMRYLADWMDQNQFLESLAIILSQFNNYGNDIASYRLIFIAVADILLYLIKSRGGFFYLTSHFETLQVIIETLNNIHVTNNNNDNEFVLIDEELISPIIQPENLQCYSRQLAFTITSVLKINENLQGVIKNSNQSYAWLYEYINAYSENYYGIVKSTLYHIIRLHPDFALVIVQKISLLTYESQIQSFYAIEILKTVLFRDRSAQLVTLIGPQLFKILIENNNVEQEGTEEIKRELQILIQLINPIIELQESFSIETLSQLVKVNIAEGAEQYSSINLITKTNQQCILTNYGTFQESGSPIIPLLTSLRLVNMTLSIYKWTSVQFIKQNFINRVKSLLGQVVHILSNFYLNSMKDSVFSLPQKILRRKQHLELCIPLINSYNIILEQLLASDLICFVDNSIFESLINLNALCENQVNRKVESSLRKTLKLINSTMIILSQFPHFPDIYFPVLLEHAMHFSFKSSSLLKIIATLLEHYTSYKDPRLIPRFIDYISKQPPQPVIPPNILYYFLSKTESFTKRYEWIDNLGRTSQKLKESRSSKYIQAGVWETKKIPSIGAESQDAWLEQILARFLLSNNLEIFDSMARILRCILNSNHYHSCVAIVKLLSKQVSDGLTRSKALLMVSNVIDIPSAKSVFINSNLADSLVQCIQNPYLEQISLKIVKVLFNAQIGLSEGDIATRIAEDFPTISQIQNILLECRRFIKFALPEGIQASKNQEKELDPLYDEFDMKETENTGCRIESTILALEALYELSKNCVGRSLLLCGMYPFRDDLPAPFDLQETIDQIHCVIQSNPDHYTQNQMSILTDLIVKVTQNAPICQQSALLKITPDAKVNQNPDVQEMQIPDSKDLNTRFPRLGFSSQALKDYLSNNKKAHTTQLLLGDRLGDRIQCKAIHTLTDLLPPPYPPLFKHKTTIKEQEWQKLAQDFQEFIPDEIINKMREEENLERQSQISNIRYSAPPEAYKAPPVMQVMPPIPTMMPAPQMMMPEQMLSDVEQNALNEVARLIEIKKTSNDPRLQNRIEQILEEHPNLISFFKSKIDGQ